jgi:hypothetical protein
LSGRQRLLFRSTERDDGFQLDFGSPLEVGELTVDGRQAEFEKDGEQLQVSHPMKKDEEYVLELTYSGVPEPVPAPSTRPDQSEGLGWRIDADGGTGTMQEPWGAYTWYAANEQPADKALYDFTMIVPSPCVRRPAGPFHTPSEPIHVGPAYVAGAWFSARMTASTPGSRANARTSSPVARTAKPCSTSV